MNRTPHVIIVDTDPTVVSKIRDSAIQLKFIPECINNPNVPAAQLEKGRNGIAFLGPSLDRELCVKNIFKLKMIDRGIPILIASDPDSFEDIASSSPVDELYPIHPALEPQSVERTLETVWRDRSDFHHHPDLPLMIGHSLAIRGIRERIRKFSENDVTVLVTGESGTGKELVARSFHYESPRSSGPLIKLNCAVLPSELLESELFGYQKGAFTDAHRNKPGRLELANGGTLFIDEIGELSLPLQAKFLHLLEETEISRLGGIRNQAIDVRIVAATNQDLVKKVIEGEFRKDLFFRLNVINLEVPPLRERMEDVPLLVHFFLEKCSYELKRNPMQLPENVMSLLLSYHWPGNIREIENLVRKMVVIGDPNIAFQDLKLQNRTPNEADETIQTDCSFYWDDGEISKVFQNHNYSIKETCKFFVAQAERAEILKALNGTYWNRRKAASLLKISYKTLLNRIQDLGLEQ